MKLIPLAGLAALLVAGAGSAALAQSQSDPNYAPGQNPNVQADQNYQAQKNAYDNQADAAARAQGDYAQQRDAYDQNSAAYQAARRDYRRRLHEYERARADYDALYGPGAYERYHAAPFDPD
jgi:hypothetical protein